MQPTALHVRDLRCFAGHHRIELRPLTLVFGRNNVGKSVITRALPLLADTLASTEEPLALSSPAARGATLATLQCRLGDSPPPLWLGLDWAEGPWHRMCFAWTGEEATERLSAPVVQQWDCLDENQRRLTMTRERTRADGRYAIRYRFSADDATPVLLQPELDGPFPIPAEPNSELAAAQRYLRAWARSVSWLAADRRPGISAPVPRRGGHILRLDPQGRNVLDVLARNQAVQQRTSEFYQTLVGRSLAVNELSSGKGYYEFVLRSERPRLDVPLTDVGEGLIQMLPVLTGLAQVDIASDAQLLAIEEPESHQHGDLQEGMARIIGQLAARHAHHRLLIETHSEVLLLTIQLMIAEGSLPAERVIMYWVRQGSDGHSTAEPVVFDRRARPSGKLPRRPFSEDTELLRRIHLARRRSNG